MRVTFDCTMNFQWNIRIPISLESAPNPLNGNVNVNDEFSLQNLTKLLKFTHLFAIVMNA